MKKIITLLSFSFTIAFCFGQGSWSQKPSYTGSGRYRAIAFEVNGKCYMGTGSTGIISHNLNDLWEFDPVQNTWTQKANFTGLPRTNATASSDGTYGYVGLGTDSTAVQKDWWQYDPSGNSWALKAGFPGGPRFGAGAFSLQNMIFVGGGLDSANNVHNDFYAYDPGTNTWNAKANLPVGVSSAATFTIGQKGYFVSGALNGSVACTTQNSEYDPVANSWTSKAAYLAGNTYSAVGFSLFGLGYVGTGFTGNLTDVMYRFDPVANSWTQETSWPTGTRQWAVSCVSGNRAFVGTGNSTGGAIFSDWWEFIPQINSVKNLSMNNNSVSAFYSQSGKEIIIKNADKNESIKIFSLDGKELFESNLIGGEQRFSWIHDGIFIVALYGGDKISTTKIVCLN